MKKWEYKLLTTATYNYIQESTLTEWGAEGWEVVSVAWGERITDSSCMRGVLLKREVVQ